MRFFVILFVHCEFGKKKKKKPGLLNFRPTPHSVIIYPILEYKRVNIKRIVEFVIPRAVSVLFFKLKATGIKRP